MTTETEPGLKLLPQYRDVTVEKRKRDYLIGGESFQRVTSALGIINKPALVPWATKIALESVKEWLKGEDADNTDAMLAWAKGAPNRTKSDAADRGTETHALVERVIKKGVQIFEEVPLELLPAVRGAVAYLNDYGITVIATEQTVWSDSLKVAGTFDGLGWMGDKLVLFDWKRSKGIYWEYALQLGAYAKMLGELTGKTPDEAHVVRLAQGDGPLYEVQVLADLDAAYSAYLSALALHRAGKTNWWQTTGEG
jgi:hypothetical protein